MTSNNTSYYVFLRITDEKGVEDITFLEKFITQYEMELFVSIAELAVRQLEHRHPKHKVTHLVAGYIEVE